MLCGAYNAARAAWIAALDAPAASGCWTRPARQGDDADRGGPGGVAPVDRRRPAPRRGRVGSATAAVGRARRYRRLHPRGGGGGMRGAASTPVSRVGRGPGTAGAVGVFARRPSWCTGCRSRIRCGRRCSVPVGRSPGRWSRAGLEQSLIPGDVVVSELPEPGWTRPRP